MKYVHEVLVNCLGGLSLPRNSVVRLADQQQKPENSIFKMRLNGFNAPKGPVLI